MTKEEFNFALDQIIEEFGRDKVGAIKVISGVSILEYQLDKALIALQRAEIIMEICSDWISEIEMPDGWTTITDENIKIREAIANVKGGAA